MTRCGFVGLGIIGRAMVRNLLAAGHEVAVFNRSPGPAAALAAEGAVPAASPRDAAQGAEVVLTCVSDSTALEAVVLGPAGVLEGAAAGTVLVDHSTVAPTSAREVASRCAERGVAALDAPVSGGEEGAVAGTLSIMVGGDAGSLERVRPLLEVLGATVRHVGPSGAGQLVKAANQLLVGGTLALVAEALLLLEAEDVDVGTAVEVLGGGLAGSRVLETKAQRMLERRFAPGARADLHRKDLAITAQVARQAGVPTLLTAVVGQLFEALHAQGRGDLDHSAVIAVLADLAGRPAGPPTPTSA